MLTTLCLALAIGSQGQTAPAVPNLKDSEKLYGLSLFWKEASDSFAYFDRVPDLDWNKAYEEYIPKVLATKSTAEYYKELRRFCGLLKDGHTQVYAPPDPAGKPTWDDGPHIDISWYGDRAFITNYHKSFEDRLDLGMEILAIDGKTPVEQVQIARKKYSLNSDDAARVFVATGTVGTEAVLKVQTKEGETKEVSLKRGYPGDWDWVLPLAWRGPTFSCREVGDGLMYVNISTFNDSKVADQFDALVPKLAKAKGLIIDIRRNGGGDDAVGHRILQHFTRGSYLGFKSKTRETNAYYRATGSLMIMNHKDYGADAEYQRLCKSHYNGTSWKVSEPHKYQGRKDAKLTMPKVVLIGPNTASAAEDFLVFIDSMPNITTVGEGVTFGSTGQPFLFNLPGGGSARICVQRVTFPDGREFVGLGIPPKVRSTPTLEDAREGRDFTFNKGIEVLKSMIKH